MHFDECIRADLVLGSWFFDYILRDDMSVLGQSKK